MDADRRVLAIDFALFRTFAETSAFHPKRTPSSMSAFDPFQTLGAASDQTPGGRAQPQYGSRLIQTGSWPNLRTAEPAAAFSPSGAESKNNLHAPVLRLAVSVGSFDPRAALAEGYSGHHTVRNAATCQIGAYVRSATLGEANVRLVGTRTVSVAGQHQLGLGANLIPRRRVV